MSLPRRLCLTALMLAAPLLADEAPVMMDARAIPVPPGSLPPAFAADPVNQQPYDFQSQLDIYGAKHPNPTARPLLELGRDLYGPGQLGPGIDLLGEKNLLSPQLLLYGDLRTAAAWNDNGGNDKGLVAMKADLDLDLKLTATERIHYAFTPLDRNGVVTSAQFAGQRPFVDHSMFDLTPDALFFEGDLGRIAAGVTDRDNGLDLPFAVGLIPLLFQNGVWMEDAFKGIAFTIPARNSPALQITNMDVTFFAGFDQVSTPALLSDHQGAVFGLNTFIEAMGGYWELGYGYVKGSGASSDLSYHNVAAAYTHRYFDTVSNTVRVIGNFGQDPTPGTSPTADGVLLLMENSLVSSNPSVLVPYLNGWAGFHRPESLARAAGAGGVLVNTGIVFETDDMTGFPKLDDTGHNTYGAALGLEYLFDLHQQIVVEVAALNAFGNPAERTTPAAEYGAGIRWQRPLNNAWILRTDVIGAVREQQANLLGFRVELRRKF